MYKPLRVIPNNTVTGVTTQRVREAIMAGQKKSKIKNTLKESQKIPIAIIIALSLVATWIFVNQILPTPSGLYIIPVFVSSPNEVNIRVEKRNFDISDNEIRIQLNGELALNEKNRILRSEGALSSEDDVFFGFSALVWTYKPNFTYYGELISNRDNFLEISGHSKDKKEYKISEREGPGYKYIAIIRLEEIPEDHCPFSIDIHFSSPRLEDEFYICIAPQFFENNIDEAESLGILRLSIPKEYNIKESSCYARRGLSELPGDTRLSVECDYEINKQFWFNVGEKDTKIWSFAFAAVILGISCCIVWIQYILTEKSKKEILRKIEEILLECRKEKKKILVIINHAE